jgi:diguanylate cyclase (GGDEF)-like protein
MTTNILTTLENLSRPLLIIVGLALLCGVGFLDYWTGYEISFSLFYLIPIALITWFTDGRLGVVTALASAGVSLLVEFLAGSTYSRPFIYLWNTFIRLGFFLLTVFFLRLGKVLEHEKALAHTDYVTGAVNARFFHALAEREIDRSVRCGCPFTVAYIDIDNFKVVNDMFGHMIGNKVLETVANSMKQHLRRTDIVARIGGDEFVVLFPEVEAKGAQTVVSNMQRRLSEAMNANGWPVTLSIGVVTFTAASRSVDEVLSIVDSMMYAVKSNGKNDIRYATHTG